MDKPWTLARWNGREYQVMGRFKSYFAAVSHGRCYHQKTGIAFSVWLEYCDLLWYEAQINQLRDEQNQIARVWYDSQFQPEGRPHIRQGQNEIKSLQSRILKLMEAAGRFAYSRRWHLESGLVDGRVKFWVNFVAKPDEDKLCG